MVTTPDDHSWNQYRILQPLMTESFGLHDLAMAAQAESPRQAQGAWIAIKDGKAYLMGYYI
jgi:hypothetical protein